MLQGGLIDYDGTIAKTAERQFDWFKYWACVNDLSFPIENVIEFQQLYNEILNANDVQAFYDHFNLPCDTSDFNHRVWPAYDNYKKRNPADLYDGIANAIKEVWNLGRLSSNVQNNQTMRLAINTTNSWKSIYPELVSNGLVNYFDSFCTAETLEKFEGSGNHISVNKPSKVSVALMLNILNAEGDATFHLGDTIADLRASHNVRRFGGLKSETLITIGAGWGYEGVEALNQGYQTESGIINFAHVLEHPSQLPDVIRLYR